MKIIFMGISYIIDIFSIKMQKMNAKSKTQNAKLGSPLDGELAFSQKMTEGLVCDAIINVYQKVEDDVAVAKMYKNTASRMTRGIAENMPKITLIPVC